MKSQCSSGKSETVSLADPTKKAVSPEKEESKDHKWGKKNKLSEKEAGRIA